MKEANAVLLMDKFIYYLKQHRKAFVLVEDGSAVAWNRPMDAAGGNAWNRDDGVAVEHPDGVGGCSRARSRASRRTSHVYGDAMPASATAMLVRLAGPAGLRPWGCRSDHPHNPYARPAMQMYGSFIAEERGTVWWFWWRLRPTPFYPPSART